MSPANAQSAVKRSDKKPEKEFAARGLKIAVWLNTTETDEGVRHFRAFSISPRRYRDESNRSRPGVKKLILAWRAISATPGACRSTNSAKN